MFLGIKYNTWHFILAFVGVIVGIIAVYLYLGDKQLTAFIAFFIPAWVVFSLQAINEFLQMKSEKSIKAHGGYENFILDSRKDWRLALIGVFAGLPVGFFIASFFI